MSSRGIPLTRKCTCCGVVCDIDELNEKGECTTCEEADDFVDEHYDEPYGDFCEEDQ